MGPLLPLGTHAAYGTEVPNVPKAHLSFLTGVQVSMEQEMCKSMQRDCNFPHQIERIKGFEGLLLADRPLKLRVSGFGLTNPELKSTRETDRMSYRREIVNRILANSGATLGIAVLGISLAIAGAGLAQTKSTKKAAPAGKDAAAVARGKELFQQKCSTCHYDTSDAKKIGPGLKGLGRRGTFTVNNNKVTDESLKTWIENGDSLMPPFKDVIDDNQIKDVIAYVKTL
jgi:mono/diheme cytochrome c family protein